MPGDRHTQGDGMNSCRKTCFAVLAVLTFGLLFCMPAIAGEPEPADLTVEDQTPTAPAPQKADPADDDTWHFTVGIYGWFEGTHGTVGVLGHNAGIHESFTDVFHYLKGIIPVAVEAQKNRFVMPVDFLWVKLGDDKLIPLTDLGQRSVNLRITQSILTPKFGYRMADTEKWKFDVLAGIRYWYVGQNLTLEPSDWPLRGHSPQFWR
jgi:hypothetical protein